MKSSQRASLGGLIMAVVLLTTTDTVVGTAAAPAASATVRDADDHGPCGDRPELRRKSFPAIPHVDNRFLPLIPGMQLIVDGFVVTDDGVQHPHQIVTTVTNLTKVIDGVRTIVVFDVDIQDGVVTESEIFFQAQDRRGTVWLLGEYPEEWEDGKLQGAPSTWLSGVLGAHAGIAMLAKPKLGTPTYMQGLARRVGFFDCATVFRTGVRTCVPVQCFTDVLVTDEFGPLDPDSGHQRKFYAPGIGTVRVAAAGGVDPETLQLTKAAMLCGHDFAVVRRAAQRQDTRAYRVAPRVYGGTAPAEATLGAPRC